MNPALPADPSARASTSGTKSPSNDASSGPGLTSAEQRADARQTKQSACSTRQASRLLAEKLRNSRCAERCLDRRAKDEVRELALESLNEVLPDVSTVLECLRECVGKRIRDFIGCTLPLIDYGAGRRVVEGDFLLLLDDAARLCLCGCRAFAPVDVGDLLRVVEFDAATLDEKLSNIGDLTDDG
jgi:hypothetical protein